MQSNTLTCLFCFGSHDTVECPAYPTISTRMSFLNDQKICYRCLIPGHIPPKCKNVIFCDGCGRLSHHKALCWKNNAIKDPSTKTDVEKCVFCARHNDSSRCSPVDTHSGRLAIIQATNRCVKCLKMHPGQACDSQAVHCTYCNKVDHHKALCVMNDRLKENRNRDPAYSSCLLCAQHKNTTQCERVKLLSQRRQILSNQGRCLKCLRLHPSVQCQHQCRICRSSEHHAVLCPNDPRIIADEAVIIEMTANQESSSSSSSSQSSTSDSSEVPNSNYHTAESSRLPSSFFDFVMNVPLPQPYVHCTI